MLLLWFSTISIESRRSKLMYSIFVKGNFMNKMNNLLINKGILNKADHMLLVNRWSLDYIT